MRTYDAGGLLQEMFLMEMLFNAMYKSIIQCLSTLIA